MKPADFEMVETLDRAALERHPVWKTFRAEDRAWILSWGVEPDWLDAELERFAYCGPEPLFPVIDCDPLPTGRSEMAVAVELTLASGHRIPGYRMEPWVLGVFGTQEYVFNGGLPRYARLMAERLAEEIGIAPEAVFPIRHRASVLGADGTPVSGETPAPW